MVFCTVKIIFKYRDATLIYTGLKLCKVFLGHPVFYRVQYKIILHNIKTYDKNGASKPPYCDEVYCVWRQQNVNRTFLKV